ncbi:hypothetical protein N7539_007656 [Penicillium diatomitis]|uniref:FCP1 homology domain-containing protein n=1 Tax=Penicillium diatomitis TaxID=2819901 RepID=A0A9W9WVW9_9EURO|nr:uncharacterized protein N7539_007656 [Penicillium diatomitis]KAJ5477512.1 hypothetical protein N7539_007656 [Penicillium diatomitis]
MPAPNVAETPAANDRATSQPASSSSAPTSSTPAMAAADAPTKKNRLHLPLPSRRSSKTDQQSASEKAAEATQDDPSRRGSRVSMLNLARERSRASSRRSRRTQQDATTVDKSPETAQPTSSGTNSPSKPLQKKGSKLFSFLSCCTSPEVDGDDNAVPPKKTSKQAVASNRLPATDKTETPAGDSSTAVSKEPTDFGDEKAAALAGDQSRSREAEPSASTLTGPQADGTSGDVLTTGVPNDGSQRHEESAFATNGVAPEPREGMAKVDEEDSSSHIPTTAERAPKAVAGETDETPSQAEEVSQSVTVLPPPPPPPVPEVAAERGQQQQWLLPPALPHLANRKCLVLDLDETLVHSSFKVLERADFTIPVEIEGQYHNIYVIKRPGVDQFMKRVGELYEVVVFTASVSKYGDPLLDQLDIHNVIHHRLFRESCYNHQGNYVKDLSQVGRDLRETIIIDNSPTSYIFHPQHAIPISSWFSDAHDNELLDLIPVLEDLAQAEVQDVSMVLDITL